MTRIHAESRNVIITTEQLQENKSARLPAAGELFTVCELLILAAGTGPTEIRLGAGTGRVLPSILSVPPVSAVLQLSVSCDSVFFV